MIRAKSISRINFLTKFHFLQFQKLTKNAFLNWENGQKCNFTKKIFWSIRFHEFFCLDFFKFSGLLCFSRIFSGWGNELANRQRLFCYKQEELEQPSLLLWSDIGNQSRPGWVAYFYWLVDNNNNNIFLYNH